MHLQKRAEQQPEIVGDGHGREERKSRREDQREHAAGREGDRDGIGGVVAREDSAESDVERWDREASHESGEERDGGRRARGPEDEEARSGQGEGDPRGGKGADGPACEELPPRVEGQRPEDERGAAVQRDGRVCEAQREGRDEEQGQPRLKAGHEVARGSIRARQEPHVHQVEQKHGGQRPELRGSGGIAKKARRFRAEEHASERAGLRAPVLLASRSRDSGPRIAEHVQVQAPERPGHEEECGEAGKEERGAGQESSGVSEESAGRGASGPRRGVEAGRRERRGSQPGHDGKRFKGIEESFRPGGAKAEERHREARGGEKGREHTRAPLGYDAHEEECRGDPRRAREKDHAREGKHAGKERENGPPARAGRDEERGRREKERRRGGEDERQEGLPEHEAAVGERKRGERSELLGEEERTDGRREGAEKSEDEGGREGSGEEALEEERGPDLAQFAERGTRSPKGAFEAGHLEAEEHEKREESRHRGEAPAGVAREESPSGGAKGIRAEDPVHGRGVPPARSKKISDSVPVRPVFVTTLRGVPRATSRPSTRRPATVAISSASAS